MNITLEVEFVKYQYFPLKNTSDLSTFDRTLNDEQVYRNWVKSLKGIGGSTPHNLVSNVLKRVISNGVAEQFSWAGAKKKMPFKTLKVAKAVIETTRLIFKNSTEDEVSILIANWLRHAKQRREREEGTLAKKDEMKEMTI